MSSYIRINRICQHCGTDFIAKTTVTKYCGASCAKKSYKVRIKNQKIESSHKLTKQSRESKLEELKARDFLTVTQVSKLIGCSRQNVYKLINTGKLKATNLLIKKTIIKRSDLDNLFEKQMPEALVLRQQPLQFDLANCYTMSDIKRKFGISDKTVYELIRRNKIPKIKSGRYTYVPMTIIDKILS